MELSGTVNRLSVGMEYLALVLLGLALAARSEKLIKLSIPGDSCGTIVEHGDQYKVSSVNTAGADEMTTSDAAEEEEDHHHDVESYVAAYPANVSCTMSFRTDSHKKFFMRITSFEMENSPRCQNDAFSLYNGLTASADTMIKSHGLYGLCGETLSLPNYFYSTENYVTLRFVTDDRNNHFRGFTILLTPYWQDEAKNCSSTEEFTCRLSKKCITRDAMCNRENQCEDGSDEPPNCRYECPTCGAISVLRESSHLGFFIALSVILLTRPAAIGRCLFV